MPTGPTTVEVSSDRLKKSVKAPPRENAKKEKRRRQKRELFEARKRQATKQQLEELVRLQAVVIPALRGRIVGLETSEAALQSLLTAKV
jgi:hypothetical protein